MAGYKKYCVRCCDHIPAGENYYGIKPKGQRYRYLCGDCKSFLGFQAAWAFLHKAANDAELLEPAAPQSESEQAASKEV